MKIIAVKFKNFLKIIIVFALVISASAVSISLKTETVLTLAEPKISRAIIIDAGHGGFDGGAVAADGTIEKNINLSIALKLGEMLKFLGYDVVYTRTSDVGTDNLTDATIQQRKKADLNNRLELMSEFVDAEFVSIHLNKFEQKSAKGAQVFYSPNNSDSKALGESIQLSVKQLLQTNNTRVCKKATQDIFLLHNAKIPAVIVECGFLSNDSELELLKTEEYQYKIAFSILCGIMSYYNG